MMRVVYIGIYTYTKRIKECFWGWRRERKKENVKGIESHESQSHMTLFLLCVCVLSLPLPSFSRFFVPSCLCADKNRVICCDINIFIHTVSVGEEDSGEKEAK